MSMSDQLHTDAHLTGLNTQQREAVECTEGPLLILAGAGSGKTRVITHRIVNLVQKGVAPHNILAVTFTNKAAKEMRERTHALLRGAPPLHHGAGRASQDSMPTVTTFHALGVRMLREHHDALGLSRNFTIYDRSDSVRAIKKSLEKAGYDPKQFEPRNILSTISRAKGDALDREAFTSNAKTFPERVAAEAWVHYDAYLRAEQALDFDDLLLKTLSMLKNHPPILDAYRQRFQFIHVDEYQDTNNVQYAIVKLLAGAHTNICVVGDVDQNIYSWRGARIANILQFERHFTGAKVVFLEENYRSTKTIIAASNDIIQKNTNRPDKNVFTKNDDGEPIALYVAFNGIEEAEHVAMQAKKLMRDGVSPSEIAILFRTNFQSRVLEEAFLNFDIPYQVLGTRFFERKEIKDVLSFLRLAHNPESTSDLARIANVPPRGIGKVTLLKLIEGARDSLTGATEKKVAAFETLMAKIRAHATTQPLSKTIRFIITENGLEEHLKKGGEEGLEKIENLRELVTLVSTYDGMQYEEAIDQLLETAALQSDQDEIKDKEERDAVRLMTVHSSKGLEFPYVFITGLEEGLFPHERLSDEKTDDEEERRLFYVALTRAGKKIFLSYAHMRMIFGSERMNAPSSFLSDISDDLLEYINPGGKGGDSGYEAVIEIE